MENHPQLSSRGSPKNRATSTSSSSSPQSPASLTSVSVTNLTDFYPTHSNALGQGVSINDGFNISQRALKQDDASAPISSLSAPVPPVNPADGVKSFGSIAAQNGVSDAAQSAVTNRPPLSSVPSAAAPSFVPKFDNAKLFTGPSTDSVPASTMSPCYYYHPQWVSGLPTDPPVTSPSSTPSEVKLPTSLPLTANAAAFIPRKKITIKSPSGQEVSLDALKQLPPAVPIAPAVTPSPASPRKKKKGRPIPIESQEQKERHLAEGRAGEGEGEEKNKTSETVIKTNDHATRRQIEELWPREVEFHKLKEEVEHAEKEWKEAEEWATREETERQEAEERAAWLDEVCKELEDRAAREVREAEEREKERLRPVECAQLEAEQREQGWFRNFRGEEETFRAVGTLIDVASDVKLELPPEGEVEDGADGMLQTNTVGGTPLTRTASVSPPVPTSTGESAKFSEQGFRFGTFLPSPELSQNRPGSRSPHTALTSNSTPVLRSVLATARHIEDINCITYPEGIKRPKVEPNVYAQKGKFQYDREFLLQFMNICKEKPDELNVNTREGKFSVCTTSAVPNESLLPDPSVKSPFSPSVSTARLTGLEATPASFPRIGSGESNGPRQQSDDSFLQHGKYFFKDGNVTFWVDGILYCVHRYLFSHDSSYFSTRFAQLRVRDHEALSVIIPLRDVKCEDFEAFLSVLYPHLKEQDLSYEQWKSVLYLSTRWGFASRRKLALESIKPPTPYDWLLLTRKYAVDQWVIPALHALCVRTAPLSLDEARGMNIEDVVLVATIREEIFRFGMSAAEIPRRVEAMQARVSVRTVEGQSYNGTKTVLTEPMNGKTPMSSGNLAGAIAKSQGEHSELPGRERYWQTTKVVPNDEWDTLLFEGEKGETQADEGQYHQTTNTAPNDDWDSHPSKRKSVKAKQLQVQQWQTAMGASSNEWDTPSL